MKTLEIRNLGKSYGGVTAVAGLTHSFQPGRITTILGPSGSGKSTTLAMIAGLLQPDSGSVVLGGVDITRTPADRRDFGMIFQNYSLFPHLSVIKNVEFGLRVRGVGAAERKSQAERALEMVHIGHLACRGIHQISGGEQQRVALARALVFNPQVLLLDEPLSALDARLREALRGELDTLLNQLGMTAVYVTHDQVEAMSLGQELVIMRAGRIEQAGAPLEVYSRPATHFVASFLGSANLVPGELLQHEGTQILQLPFCDLPLPGPAGRTDGACTAMIRPEDLEPVGRQEAHFQATVTAATFFGNATRLALSAAGCALCCDSPNERLFRQGESVFLRIKADKVCLVPQDAPPSAPCTRAAAHPAPGPQHQPHAAPGLPEQPGSAASLTEQPSPLPLWDSPAGSRPR